MIMDLSATFYVFCRSGSVLIFSDSQSGIWDILCFYLLYPSYSIFSVPSYLSAYF